MSGVRTRARAFDTERAFILMLSAALALVPAAGATAQAGYDFEGDRNAGTPVSMFGTYVRSGELLVYGFYEYYTNRDAEYGPNEFGYLLDRDYRAPSGGHEALVWLGYGVTDRLALEFEAALYTTAFQEKAPGDPTAMPARIEESGLGDVEGQIRYRWARASPEQVGIFSYFEYVLPLQKNRDLIGTSAWQFKLGTGFVRTFSFGTMTLRVAAEYDRAERKIEPGEYSVEWLKRVSPTVRVYAGIEGSQDEVAVVPVLMWAPHPHVALHLNSAFGISSKMEDWAPEVGVMISLP